MQVRHGAAVGDWQHFDLMLGLTADLLPVVSNLGAKISGGSSMKGLGKTPSKFNASREAVGFSQWTQHHSTGAEVANWAREPDYGICIQTRHVRAIDVDIPDLGQSTQIMDKLAHLSLPMRYRANSAKFLLIFEMSGDFAKRKFKTEHGIIEFLATGQQFVACGTHTSGARYEWAGGLPDNIPALTEAKFNEVWFALVNAFAIEEPTESASSTKAATLSAAIQNDPQAMYLVEKNLVAKTERDGRMHLECPWQDEHTSGEAGDTSTTYWPANTGGYAQGHYHCLHAHCDSRTDAEFSEALGYTMPVDSEFEAITDTREGEAGAERSKFHVHTGADFGDFPPPEWLIKGILPRAEMGVIFGDSASGKTFLAIDMCMAIARGIEWRGAKTKPDCRVVYVAAEDAYGVRLRFEAYAAHHAITLADHPVGFIFNAPNMQEKKDADEIAQQIKAFGKVDLIILDTMAQVMPGANENSGEDVGKVLRHCKRVHQHTGAMVAFLHHSGKDSTRGARGWSGLRAAADVEIMVERSNNHRSATITKQKNGQDGQEFGFSLLSRVMGFDSDDEEITSCTVEHNEVGRAAKEPKQKEGKWTRVILGILKSSLPPLSRTDLIAIMVEQGCPNNRTAAQSVAGMLDGGRLVEENNIITEASK